MKANIVLTIAFVLLSGVCEVILAQYQPWKVPQGTILPGERFIELVVPRYTVHNKPFIDVLGEISERYGVRFAVRATVLDRFDDHRVSLDSRAVSFKELINRLLVASRYANATWRVDASQPDLFYVDIGRRDSGDPLNLRVDSWSVPPDTTPENLLVNLPWYIPEFRSHLYGSEVGVAGSVSPRVTYGCQLVMHLENTTVLDIAERVSRIAGKSWIFIHVQNDVRRSHWQVF